MPEKADVFIIDDDAKTLRYYQSIVKQGKDLRCIGVTTKGESALDILSISQPDIVLIDYALYPQSGFDLLAKIRQEFPDLPVILLGGRPLLKERALAAGAAAYLPMPITPRHLLDAIRQALHFI
jgi:CitB family two-component system response regulator CitT